MNFLNIAAYKFVEIPVQFHSAWRVALKEYCDNLNLKGTILLAPEGINLFIAGEREQISSFLNFLIHNPLFENRFSDLNIKESLSEKQPFNRMLVRLKKEIITMRHPAITLSKLSSQATRAPSVDPIKLKNWLDKGCDDEGRKIVLLDTRNSYEVDLGSFENALSLGLEFFGDFPAAIKNAPEAIKEDLKNKTIVTFCTGGIRCEKANLYMTNELGLPNVYQLDGGILNYFEKCGGTHWKGECFVFDHRTSVDCNLHETNRSRENI